MRRYTKHTETRVCRVCQKTRTLGWFPGKNRDKCTECYSSRGAWNWKKLGIENFHKEDYTALVLKQGDRCAICHKPDPVQALSVDHDHATGKVRGLLCNNCNRGIGMLGDNSEVMAAAAAYLKPHESFNRPDWFVGPSRESSRDPLLKAGPNEDADAANEERPPQLCLV